jgi:hypothetical protein
MDPDDEIVDAGEVARWKAIERLGENLRRSSCRRTKVVTDNSQTALDSEEGSRVQWLIQL